jgi:four helix bundle protein
MLNTKSETRNSKQIQNQKRYDLGDRTAKFAKDTMNFVSNVPRNISNIGVAKQLVRSSGSVGANFIEAEEALSKKDFVMRIKISRKEAKESRYWLGLIQSSIQQADSKERLIQEATELMLIFGSIVQKNRF